MAQVTIDISEYDSLRNRIKELENLLSEEKTRSEKEANNHQKEVEELINQSKVIIKTPIISDKDLYCSINFSIFTWSENHGYRNFIFSDLVNNITDNVGNMISSINKTKDTYVNFSDIEEEIRWSIREDIQQSVKFESEWEAWYKSKAEELEKEYSAKVSEINKERKSEINWYDRTVKGLREELIPKEEKLSSFLEGLDYKLKKGIFGTRIVKIKH